MSVFFEFVCFISLNPYIILTLGHRHSLVPFNGETQTYKLNSQPISSKFSLGVNFRASVLTPLFGFAN